MTFEQAVDEVLDLFKSAWDSTGHEAFYEDIRDQRDQSTDPWSLVIVRHASGFQNNLGGNGNRKFLRLGVLIVTIHTLSSSGLSSGYQLAKLVADAYEGVSSPNGVWFRNVRINELGRDGSFYRINVLVDFEYHETK